jgi:chemosensory pili system protein ChpC
MTLDIVRSMLLPITGANILLPNTAVAEIIPYVKPKRHMSLKTTWLLGVLSWRKVEVPIISIELFDNQDAPYQIPTKARIAVLNMINNHDKLEFIGILLQGYPKLSRVTSHDIEFLSEDTGNIFHHEVLVRGKKAYFVDFDTIQEETITIMEALCP